jgi:hypothetical protein
MIEHVMDKSAPSSDKKDRQPHFPAHQPRLHEYWYADTSTAKLLPPKKLRIDFEFLGQDKENIVKQVLINAARQPSFEAYNQIRSIIFMTKPDRGTLDEALFEATKHDCSENAELLLDNGANPAAQGAQAYLAAVGNENLRLMKQFRAKKPTLINYDPVALKDAAHNDFVDVAKYILDNNINREHNIESAYGAAFRAGNTNILNLFDKHGASIGYVNSHDIRAAIESGAITRYFDDNPSKFLADFHVLNKLATKSVQNKLYNAICQHTREAKRPAGLHYDYEDALITLKLRSIPNRLVSSTKNSDIHHKSVTESFKLAQKNETADREKLQSLGNRINELRNRNNINGRKPL